MQLSRTHANDQTNVNSSSFSQVNKNKHASNDESFERITRAHLSRQIDVARPTLRGSEGWILSDKNNILNCIFAFVSNIILISFDLPILLSFIEHDVHKQANHFIYDKSMT